MNTSDKTAWAMPLIALGAVCVGLAATVFFVKVSGGLSTGFMRHFSWMIVGLCLGLGLGAVKQGLDYKKLTR